MLYWIDLTYVNCRFWWYSRKICWIPSKESSSLVTLITFLVDPLMTYRITSFRNWILLVCLWSHMRKRWSSARWPSSGTKTLSLNRLDRFLSAFAMSDLDLDKRKGIVRNLFNIVQNEMILLCWILNLVRFWQTELVCIVFFFFSLRL